MEFLASAYFHMTNEWHIRETSPCFLPFVQYLGLISIKDQAYGETGHRSEALAVLWGIYLLPNNEWQPSLQHVSHLIHRRDDDRSLLIVIGAYLVSPAKRLESAIQISLQAMGYRRHAEAR